PFEALLGLVQIAPVVQRPSAAERLFRELYLEAGALEELGRGDQRSRAEIVVERVRPQQQAIAPNGPVAPLTEPIPERLRRETWQPRVRVNPRNPLGRKGS